MSRPEKVRLALFSMLLFIGTHISVKGSLAGVPRHVQQTEAQLAETGVCNIEIGCIHYLLNELWRDLFTCPVMFGKCIEKFFLDGKVSMICEGSSTKSQ